jgi:hypothetical protein
VKKLSIEAHLWSTVRQALFSQLDDATPIASKKLDALTYQATKGIQRINNRAAKAAFRAAMKADKK